MSFYKVLGIVLAAFLGINCGNILAQSSAVKQAEKKIGQGSWTAAREVLQRALKKDTLNPEIEVALANLFLNEHNPGQKIDTAYGHCLRALSQFSRINLKQRDRLKRDFIDSAVIVSLRGKIEKAAFDEAKQTNTEKSYNDYLHRYTFSQQRSTVTELRDEVAFLDALKQNSYKAFESYMQKYPNSHRGKEAKSRYEKLLFETKTHDRKLVNFEGFVKEFPQSPYKKEAERKIFEVLTCNGSPEEFIKFIEEHSENSYAGFARNILFHLFSELDEKMPSQYITDSLKNVEVLSKLIWAPIYKNGKYGFIDSEGEEALQPQFDNIDENYKCGLVDTDILMTSAGLVSRSGKILSRAKSFKDLGYGFLKIADSSRSILHKSGAMICSGFDDVSVLDGKYLRVAKGKRVGLLSLTGKELLRPEFLSIEIMAGVVVLDRTGKKILITAKQLTAAADGSALDESLVFDEVKDFGEGRLLVHNGLLEGIIDSDLAYVIPLARQLLSRTPAGILLTLDDQLIFTDLKEVKNEKWASFQIHRQWLRLKNASGERLFDLTTKKTIDSRLDSVWFENALAFTRRGDSIQVHISSTRKLDVPVDSKLFFIKSPDSIRYFFVQQKNKKTVFDIGTAAKLFTAEFDYIESLNADYFLVTRKNKKGILNTKGRIVLPMEYDILMLKGDFISLYKDKKFGLYSISDAQVIKPTFERNLIPLDTVLISFQHGHYGLIDLKGKAISAFEFDEIQAWAKGTVWVKNDFDWSLLDLKSQKKILTRIKNFKLIKNTPDEKLAIVKQDNLFGVVSSVHGIVIPPSFTFLMNLGTDEEPLYFTSKDVEEAGIVAVIYYDKAGKFLRKQVYEDEEYARIVCPQD